ncbi:hypothetical protein BHE74_00034990 [Ensete ventricosum]|nr:hypothetical protein BHE74_00034990 [Ensete ventricosum]
MFTSLPIPSSGSITRFVATNPRSFVPPLPPRLHLSLRGNHRPPGTPSPLFLFRRSILARSSSLLYFFTGDQVLEHQPAIDVSLTQNFIGSFCLTRKKELDWFYEGGAAAIFPDGLKHCINLKCLGHLVLNKDAIVFFFFFLSKQVIPDAGHSANEPGIAAALVATNEKFKSLLRSGTA